MWLKCLFKALIAEAICFRNQIHTVTDPGYDNIIHMVILGIAGTTITQRRGHVWVNHALCMYITGRTHSRALVYTVHALARLFMCMYIAMYGSE